MTAKSKINIGSESSNTYLDNVTGSITPTAVRAFNTDLIDSYVDTLLTGASTGTMLYWADATTPTALVLGSSGSLMRAGATAPNWLGIAGAGSLLRSDGSQPVWSSATFPNTVPAGGYLLNSSGANAWTAANVIGVTSPAGAAGLTVIATSGDGMWLQAQGASQTIQVGETATGGFLRVTTGGQLDIATSNTTRWTVGITGALFSQGLADSGTGVIAASGLFDSGLRVARTATAPIVLSGGGLTFTGSQIPGTTTSDSASAGNIGEFTSASITRTGAITLTSAAASNVATLSLTAGDWDVMSETFYTGSTTTTVNGFLTSISTTSATQDISSVPFRQAQLATFSQTPFLYADPTLVIPEARISLSTTTNVFLVAQAVFATAACTVYGSIMARRRR